MEGGQRGHRISTATVCADAAFPRQQCTAGYGEGNQQIWGETTTRLGGNQPQGGGGAEGHGCRARDAFSVMCDGGSA